MGLRRRGVEVETGQRLNQLSYTPAELAGGRTAGGTWGLFRRFAAELEIISLPALVSVLQLSRRQFSVEGLEARVQEPPTSSPIGHRVFRVQQLSWFHNGGRLISWKKTTLNNGRTLWGVETNEQRSEVFGGTVLGLRSNILSASRTAESACEIDDKAYQQYQPKPAAADDGTTKVKPAAAE